MDSNYSNIDANSLVMIMGASVVYLFNLCSLTV